MLTHAPILKALNFFKPFSLATDANDLGIGSVLSQKDNENMDHPVAYHPKKN